jgi:CBS domain containing-hemolysin-like protein
MMLAAIVLTLVILNGLFVAAEFAIVGAPLPALEHLAAQGHRRARFVLAIRRDPRLQDRFIATAQLGITFASLGLGMYAEHRVAELLLPYLAMLGTAAVASSHTVASVLAIAGLTYLHIVLGEMVPKTLALQHAQATALWIARPMAWIQAALRPLVLGLNGLGMFILGALGITRSTQHHAPDPETLRFVVEDSVAKGELEEDAGEVLAELFEFGQLTAVEVMTPRVRVLGLPRGANAAEIRAVLVRGRHARYPVYDETLDRIVGLVLMRDLLAILVDGRTLDGEAVRTVPFVPETSTLDTVLTRMRQSHTQFVVVMDEHGGTAGIVTIEDLFEEIVGEISDGSAVAPPIFEVEGELHTLGMTRLDELGEYLDRNLERPDVDTVSGLVLSLLDRPPEVGDRVAWQALEFEVRALHGRGVRECAVHLPVPSADVDESPAADG